MKDIRIQEAANGYVVTVLPQVVEDIPQNSYVFTTPVDAVQFIINQLNCSSFFNKRIKENHD